MKKTIQPDLEIIGHDSIAKADFLELGLYLRGFAASANNHKLKAAAELLIDAGNHICAQGYYGCRLGDNCTSDHK